MKVVLSLQYSVNARRPIFALPTELFNHIMEDMLPTTVPIGASKIDQFWRPLFQDSTALIPVSQTSRHFRQIALARPQWWSSLASRKTRLFPLCATNSSPMSLTVVPFPEDSETDVLKAFDDTAASRIEELHIVRGNRTVLKGVRNLFSMDKRAPALKALTCIAVPGECDYVLLHLLPLSFTLYPERTWALKHLVLDRTEFSFHDGLLYQMPSVTHLLLAGLSTSHRNIARLIMSCPNLQTLVLSHLRSKTEEGVIPNTRFPLSTRIRRVTLHDLRRGAIEFYLTLIQPPPDGIPRMALQILNEQVAHNLFGYEPLIEQRLAGKATHLRIGVFIDTVNSYRFSVTLASRVNALRFASTAGTLAASQYRGPDTWLSRLLHADITNLSDVREAWLVNTTAPFTIHLTIPGCRPFCNERALRARDPYPRHDMAPTCLCWA